MADAVSDEEEQDAVSDEEETTSIPPIKPMEAKENAMSGDEEDDDDELDAVDPSAQLFSGKSVSPAAPTDSSPTKQQQQQKAPSVTGNEEEEAESDDDGIQATMGARQPLPEEAPEVSVIDQEAGARTDARDRLLNGDANTGEEDQQSIEELTASCVDQELVKATNWRMRSLGKDNQAVFTPDVTKFRFCRKEDRNGAEIVPHKMPSLMFCYTEPKRSETMAWLVSQYGFEAVVDAMVIIESSVGASAGQGNATRLCAYARVEVTEYHTGPDKLSAYLYGSVGLFPMHPPEALKMIKTQASRVPKALHGLPGKVEYIVITPKAEAAHNNAWEKLQAQKPAEKAPRKRNATKPPAKAAEHGNAPAPSPASNKAPVPVSASTADGTALPNAAMEEAVSADDECDAHADDRPLGAASADQADQAQVDPQIAPAPPPPPKRPRHEPPPTFICPPPASVFPTVRTCLYGQAPPGGGRVQDLLTTEHKPRVLVEVNEAVPEGVGAASAFSVKLPLGVSRITGQLFLEFS